MNQNAPCNRATADASTGPVQPGNIRLVTLKTPGKLQIGDTVETARLGKCRVATIQSTDTICVENKDGRYFNLSGLGFKARFVKGVPAQ